ncbi:MAG: hypothetical protein CVV27_13925 [Candidatus Melainabacteria bacterium HGW-Melainabacteria-1]|nr:MAG: hypothetical protein CVV27_13925 [Candidatus Melainabacteria bacterium HGW-Melainabacteria-1]
MEDENTVQVLKIMIVDDRPLARFGLKQLLQQERWPGFEHIEIETAHNYSDALALLERFKPDLALIRIDMFELAGRELIQRLRVLKPELKALLYSEQPGGDYRAEIAICGAQGFLSRDLPPANLVPALLSVYYGGYFCNGICLNKATRQLPAKIPVQLSGREAEVLKLIAEDCSRENIAERLCISVRTVDTYRSRLLKKLGVNSSIGLTRYAIEHGISPFREQAVSGV